MRLALPAALVVATAFLAGCVEEPATCDVPITAVAHDNGTIFLDWEPMGNATFYRIERQAGDGPNQTNYGGTVDPQTNFTDVGEPGVTYRYRVLGYDLDSNPTGCGAVEVTAVPLFPGLAAAVALVGAVGAFVLLRRRA